jgi:hypothetical protein
MEKYTKIVPLVRKEKIHTNSAEVLWEFRENLNMYQDRISFVPRRIAEIESSGFETLELIRLYHEYAILRRVATVLVGKLSMLFKDRATAFWECVDAGNVNSCWEWLGLKCLDGYGVFHYTPSIRENGVKARPKQQAHRFSLLLTGAEFPPGHMACHTCDNPPCVNPCHLYVGTRRDNSRDCIARGRQNSPAGENNARSKLSDSIVVDIRERALSGESASDLAREYEIVKSTVCNVLHGNTWAHAPGPIQPKYARGKRK